MSIAHDRFESAARAQAKGLGLPSLPLAVIPQADYWGTDEQVRQAADKVFADLERALTQPQAKPAQ